MNFAGVLQAVTDFLEGQGARHAVIGGVALAMYGLPRTTVDLDLVVDFAVQDALIRWLEARGYRTLHRSGGYSNHSHSDPAQGDLDFVYVRGETAEKLFGACRRVPGPGGREAPVPSPEHLAALKVAALKNDPERVFRDQEDLRFLVRLPGVDRGAVRRYFEDHGLGDRFDEIL